MSGVRAVGWLITDDSGWVGVAGSSVRDGGDADVRGPGEVGSSDARAGGDACCVELRENRDHMMTVAVDINRILLYETKEARSKAASMLIRRRQQTRIITTAKSYSSSRLNPSSSSSSHNSSRENNQAYHQRQQCDTMHIYIYTYMYIHIMYEVI